uniref:Uncharacterized protein n=1 Tax=Mycena chlorophos TaxID=658473 RepID=A0ABQ0KUG0_MYCCL|nr:predicted protein [Mycena chlorophos]
MLESLVGAEHGGTATLSKLYDTSNISFIHHKAINMSMRAPRTPGGPLRDMYWLHATAADGAIGPLIAEIQRLQQEIDRANESIDDKFDKLEDNGVGVVGKLDNILQDESSTDAFTATLPSEPPTPPTHTTDALRSDLRSVNANLNKMKEQWEEEKERLFGEKAGRCELAKRQGSDGGGRAGIEGVSCFVCTGLMPRLRASSAEQTRAQREREDVLAQLQRTETDMGDVKHQLQRLEDENCELQSELRTNANAEQKARLLSPTCGKRRGCGTAASRADSACRGPQGAATEACARLPSKRTAFARNIAPRKPRTTIDNTISTYSEPKSRTCAVVDALTDLLQRAEAEKVRLSAEKSDVAKAVASMRAEMARVRREAEALGRDLKHLRSEKERLESKHGEESAREQSQAQELRDHVCGMDDRPLSALKLQHNRECKGLMKFLKAQKDYLLVVPSKLQKSEQHITATHNWLYCANRVPAFKCPTTKEAEASEAGRAVVDLLREGQTREQLVEGQTASKRPCMWRGTHVELRTSRRAWRPKDTSQGTSALMLCSS